MKEFTVDDFTYIKDALSAANDMVLKLNRELGYNSNRFPAPFQLELEAALRIFCKYAPDDYLIGVALGILQDKFSSDRAEKRLMQEYSVKEQRAKELVETAWELFTNDDRDN